jgi:hypothetical protein
LRPVELLGAVLLVASVVTLNFLKTRYVVDVPHEQLAAARSA